MRVPDCPKYLYLFFGLTQCESCSCRERREKYPLSRIIGSMDIAILWVSQLCIQNVNVRRTTYFSGNQDSEGLWRHKTLESHRSLADTTVKRPDTLHTDPKLIMSTTHSNHIGIASVEGPFWGRPGTYYVFHPFSSVFAHGSTWFSTTVLLIVHASTKHI